MAYMSMKIEIAATAAIAAIAAIATAGYRYLVQRHGDKRRVAGIVRSHENINLAIMLRADHADLALTMQFVLQLRELVHQPLEALDLIMPHHPIEVQDFGCEILLPAILEQ